MLSEDRSLNPEQDDFALQLRQLAPSHRLDPRPCCIALAMKRDDRYRYGGSAG